MKSIELDESMELSCTLYTAAEYEEHHRSSYAFARLPPEEQRKQREQDRSDFPDWFWLGPLASGTAGQSGREELVRIRAFIRANGIDEGRDLHSADLEELILEAVEEDQLIPVIDRTETTGGVTTLSGSAQSSRLPSSLTRAPGSSFSALSGPLSGEPILPGPYDPAAQEAKLKAAREAADGGNESGGFDWLGAAEAAAGALADAGLGGADNGSDGGDSMLKSFGDSNGGGGDSLLGDAEPFEYVPDELSDDSFDIAASTNNPRYAAKMLGYDQNTFSDMLHEFKPANGLGPADNVIFHDDGSVEFNKQILDDNIHNYAP